MQTSATGISTNNAPALTMRGNRGFTLVELLVVLFIIGITLSFATLSISGDNAAERLQREAERLQALMDIAKEEAVLFGVEIGLDLTREGYRFLRLYPDGWRVIKRGDTPLQPRSLPEAMELRLLRREDSDKTIHALAPTGPDREDDEEQASTDLQPEVLFLSSGTTLPFKLALWSRKTNLRFLFEGERSGRITMKRVQPAGP